jgi:hypothetical protein
VEAEHDCFRTLDGHNSQLWQDAGLVFANAEVSLGDSQRLIFSWKWNAFSARNASAGDMNDGRFIISSWLLIEYIITNLENKMGEGKSPNCEMNWKLLHNSLEIAKVCVAMGEE